MKITDVEAIILRQPSLDNTIGDGSQDDLLIRIHTDAGIVGISEVDSAPEVVRAAIMAPDSHRAALGLRSLLIGEDPLDVERLWRKMYEGAIYYARRGVGMHAISGLDIALWDIRGQALGKPVSELLGTPRRQRVRAYASTLMPDTSDAVHEHVQELVAGGFTAIKFGWGPLGHDLAHDLQLIQAARHAAGNGAQLIIDVGTGYGADVAAARQLAHACEERGIAFLEEPFGPDELDAYADLANSVTIPISTGEQLSTLGEFRDLIERGHVDIIQPDVTRCGGLTEFLRIAEFARSRGVTVIPHIWKSGIIKATSLQLLAVLPDAPYLEYSVTKTTLNTGLTRQHFPLSDGYVTIPTEPGLGVDLDTDVLDRLRLRI